jgi:hypothetical protein
MSMPKRPTLVEQLKVKQAAEQAAVVRAQIDELVLVRAQLNPLKERDKKLTEGLRKHLGLGYHRGNTSAIEIKDVPRDELDVKLIRAQMTDAWIAKYSKVDYKVTYIYVKPLIPEKAV